MNARMEKISITIPRDIAEMLKEYVPQGQVSSFASEALFFKLQMEKQKRALEAGKGAWKETGHPDLKKSDDTRKWLGQLRSHDEERIER